MLGPWSQPSLPLTWMTQWPAHLSLACQLLPPCPIPPSSTDRYSAGQTCPATGPLHLLSCLSCSPLIFSASLSSNVLPSELFLSTLAPGVPRPGHLSSHPLGSTSQSPSSDRKSPHRFTSGVPTCRGAPEGQNQVRPSHHCIPTPRSEQMLQTHVWRGLCPARECAQNTVRAPQTARGDWGSQEEQRPGSWWL